VGGQHYRWGHEFLLRPFIRNTAILDEWFICQ